MLQSNRAETLALLQGWERKWEWDSGEVVDMSRHLDKAKLDEFDAWAKQEIDRREEIARDAEGWCNDMEVASGIWGRRGADANKLHVLIHRLRKAIGDAGFEPWCIEKRQWGVRVRLSEVMVE